MRHLVIAVKTTEGGLWILPHVREARQRDAHVTIITPPGPGRLVREIEILASRDSGVKHRVVPFDFSFRRPGRVVVGLWRLRRILRDLAADTVLYHLYATALAFRIATLGLKVRRVYMVAGPLYLDSRIIRVAERVLARLDDRIICGSEHIRDRYLALGLPESRLITIPYGVDTVRFSPGEPADCLHARDELGLKRSSFVVVMVSFVYAPKRLVHRGEGIKGHGHLLNAWEVFHARHPDASLLLVGGGFDEAGKIYREQLIGLVSGGLEEQNITWLSSVEDVRSAYLAADLSISPSLSENHGAALEASSMGKPVVVSNAGALPEAVVDDSGWIYSAGSTVGMMGCLEAAYQEWTSGTLSSRGKRARELMIEKFDVTDLSREVLDCVAD